MGTMMLAMAEESTPPGKEAPFKPGEKQSVRGWCRIAPTDLRQPLTPV